MSVHNGLVIESGVLIKYIGNAGLVVIPEGVTIHGTAYSEAERYARNNGIPFREIGE